MSINRASHTPVDRGGGLERVRHLKRGTEYEVLGEAELQIAGRNVFEEDRLIVYRSVTDGKIWAREVSEFRDGRFETIAAAPSPDEDGDGAFPDEAIQAALKVYHETHDTANVDDEPEDLDHAAMEFALLEADKVRSGKLVPSTGIEEKGGQRDGKITVELLDKLRIIAQHGMAHTHFNSEECTEILHAISEPMPPLSDSRKGASASQTGLLPKGDAPDGSSSQATAIPSRGRFINGVEDLPSEEAMSERGLFALPDSVRYDIEREARSIVNVFAPEAPPALCQSIKVALLRAEKRRIRDVRDARVSNERPEAEDPKGLSPSGRQCDGEAGTPKSSSTPPTPEAQTPSDDRMTVEEAREMLAASNISVGDAEHFIAFLRTKMAPQACSREMRKYYLNKASVSNSPSAPFRIPVRCAMGEARRKTIFVAEINATELTLRIAEIAIGLKRPPGRDAAQCLADLRAEQPQLCATFDRMAQAAAEYVTECIRTGSQPS